MYASPTRKRSLSTSRPTWAPYIYIHGGRDAMHTYTYLYLYLYLDQLLAYICISISRYIPIYISTAWRPGGLAWALLDPLGRPIYIHGGRVAIHKYTYLYLYLYLYIYIHLLPELEHFSTHLGALHIYPWRPWHYTHIYISIPIAVPIYISNIYVYVYTCTYIYINSLTIRVNPRCRYRYYIYK